MLWFFFSLVHKETEGSAHLKFNKSASLSLNHHAFSNTEPIYTKYSFVDSLLNYLGVENQNKIGY